MTLLKKYWYLLLSLLAALAFLISRIFIKAPRTSSSDTEEMVDKLLTAEKARLNSEKSQLLEKEKEIEKKEYTDEEIEKKYNS